MANVYNTLILNSYADTISGQIDKIEDARDVIKSKAIELGLKIPARLKLTSNALGTSDLILAESHSLLDTAAAIDTIVVNTPPSETASSLGAGGSYTVPVGYNKVAYTITATGLEDQIGGNATPLDILLGKTAWVKGSQVTGAMLDKTGDQGASGISSYQHTDGKHYLALTIPETGKYEGGKSLQSNIAYNYADELLILPITIYHTNKEELAIDTSQATFQAGYYSGAFNVLAVLKDGGNKVLNVSNNVSKLESQSGNLIIPNGFDYFAPNASYTIKDGTIGTPLVDDDYILKVPVQEGWVNAGVITYEGQDQQYAMTEADTQVSTKIFKVEALSNTLMKSLEINTSIITERLRLI